MPTIISTRRSLDLFRTGAAPAAAGCVAGVTVLCPLAEGWVEGRATVAGLLMGREPPRRLPP